jgi:hypothetical protein
VGVQTAALQQMAGQQVLGVGVEPPFAQRIGLGDVAPQLGLGDTPRFARMALRVGGSVRMFPYFMELCATEPQLEDFLNPLPDYQFGSFPTHGVSRPSKRRVSRATGRR